MAESLRTQGRYDVFLGLVNFSARFKIPDLASIAEPLHRLTKKDIPFVWSVEEQNAFDALKGSLPNAETPGIFRQQC